jgi:hypothetical protein
LPLAPARYQPPGIGDGGIRLTDRVFIRRTENTHEGFSSSKTLRKALA